MSPARKTRRKAKGARPGGSAARRPRAPGAAARRRAPGRKGGSASRRTLRRVKAAAGSRLELVPKAPRTRTSAAVPAAAEGDEKQRLLFDLARSRAVFHAAIKGLSAEAAERPLGPGKWNVREIVLHLTVRDRVRVRELESTLLGRRASWEGISEEEMDRANAEDLAPLRHLRWDEALELLDSTRRELLEAVESVPEDPPEVWREEHAFGWMMLRLPPHDVHHAQAIERWRAEQGV